MKTYGEVWGEAGRAMRRGGDREQKAGVVRGRLRSAMWTDGQPCVHSDGFPTSPDPHPLQDLSKPGKTYENL